MGLTFMTNLFLIWIPVAYFSDCRVWNMFSTFLLKYLDPLQHCWAVKCNITLNWSSWSILPSYTQLFLQWNTWCSVVKFVLKVCIAWLHRYRVTRYTYWGPREEDKFLQIVCPFHCYIRDLAREEDKLLQIVCPFHCYIRDLEKRTSSCR